CSWGYVQLDSEVKEAQCPSCSFWGDTQVGQSRTNSLEVFRSGSQPNYSELTIRVVWGNCESGTLKPVPAGTIWVRGAMSGVLGIPLGGSGSAALSANATIESLSFEISPDLPTDDIFCA
ncbi:MAG: hypothetical protein LC723_03895, partial [Actinobacteria bacterium]|nr:hypothetical protein [Actinomycetota bacterium]